MVTIIYYYRHYYYSFSQSLWYISQIRIEILKNYLFNLHIIVSLVHIKKVVSHVFEQVANALVHSCKWLCTVLCSFLHYQLLMSCWSNCIVMGLYWIVSPPQHLGISSLHKSLHAKWLNKLSYVKHISIHFHWTFFLNLSWIGKLLPGESWLSLKKGNVCIVRSTNDQPVYWNSSKVHLLNRELASLYIAGAQHNVTLSKNLWPNRQERQEV